MAKKNEYELLTALRDELNAILGDTDTAPKTAKTEPADEDDFSEMSYNDLKKYAKAHGVSASGSRDEIIARLNGATDDDEDDDEPVQKPTKGGKSKKSTPVEDDDDDEDDEDEDDDEEDIQSQVEAATEDMTLEDLAEFCKDNGLSPKGKRAALIARIVKAVEDGDIELSDDDDDEDEEDDDDEEAPTKERLTAMKAHDKDTRQSFKNGELERADLVEFLCDFYDKDKKAYKKASDKEILDMYIEASSNLIDDDGEFVEEGAYTVNGVPFCCGRPLSYDEDSEQYVCEHCGESYEADEE